MTITLPLEPQKEAKLIAVAESKGMTADELVSQAIDKIIAEAAEAAAHKEPTHSLRGLLAKYGAAPSAEEIDQNRAEMFANFPRSDF
jgi:predicted lipoprotein